MQVGTRRTCAGTAPVAASSSQNCMYVNRPRSNTQQPALDSHLRLQLPVRWCLAEVPRCVTASSK